MTGSGPAVSSTDDAEKSDVEKQQAQQAETERDVPQENIQSPYFINAAQSQDSKRRLPSMLDHFNAKDLKKLFKCSIAVWIQTILIFINPTLRVMGSAAFVGCIVLFLAPPAGILFIQLMATLSILVGLSIGWAWGVIAMKAALATRPAADVAARYALLQQMERNATYAGQALGQGNFLQIQIFEGFLLDTRVIVTYFCLVGLFVYLVARLRVAVPKLILVQMLAVIVSNVFLTDAPLIPTFQGTLAKTLVLPCAIATGIGAVCNILIFPTSSSSEALDGMKILLSPMPTFLDACLFSFKHPRLIMSTERLVETRLQILKAYKALEPATNFLHMDVSIGRWSSDDFSTLGMPLRRVIISFLGLVEVHRAREQHKEKDGEALKLAEAIYDVSDGKQSAAKPGHHQIGRAVDFRLKSRHPSRDDLMEKSLRGLSISSERLIEACNECFTAIQEALSQSNSRQQSTDQTDMLQRHKDALEQLKENRVAFVNLAAQHLLEPHNHLFDDEGLLKLESDHFPPLTGLMLGLLFEERILQLADALDKLLSRIVELESSRTKRQLWLPNRLMGLARWIFRTEAPGGQKAIPDMNGSESPKSGTDMVQSNPGDKTTARKDPKSAHAQLISMRIPNSRRRSQCSTILLKIIHWFASTEGIYALRVLVVTLALCIPAVIRSTAGFYYREKGLWGVIMAQLSMVPYTADLVYGVAVRIIGTVVGGVIGMVAWYIGAGKGQGNPYGMAAIMAVVIIVFMWWRLFSSPLLMPAGIMAAATAYLVVAYSWANAHMPSYGNTTAGYSVFWHRLVLVLIGFSAAIIVNFLPRPPSANRHYRRLLAESLGSVRDRYALFASSWANPPSDLSEVAEREALVTGEVLFSIAGPIKLTRLEFSTSNIDADTLSQVCQLCTVLNQGMTQMLLYSARLSPELKTRIIPPTGAAEAELVVELMSVLTLVQQALKSGDPLPAMLHTPLFAKSIESARRHVDGGETAELFVRDNLGDEGLRKYVSILNALVQLLGALDELVLVLKRAVGESSDVMLMRV